MSSLAMSSSGSGAGAGGIAGLYDLRETLGKGHYATVKAARHVFTGEKVAVKVIDKSKLDEVSRGSLLKEVLCMKLVQHPNVVKLYEVIDTREKLYLVLELGQGDLYDLIKKRGLSEGVARGYFNQILAAVSYCHKLHVAHRDLKPENVVYFPPPPPPSSGSVGGGCGDNSAAAVLGLVKLTDFGFSNKFCPGEKLETSCGSLAYSAPEILLGDSYDAPAVDVWSLGVLLYVLVVGVAPFQEANDSETLTMIMDVKYRVPEGVSGPCRDLISRMLLRDPAKRASIKQILSHPWVLGGDSCCSGDSGCHGDSDGGGGGMMTSPLIEAHRLSEQERERVLAKMVGGGVVEDPELVRRSLESDAYDYLTSTFYLLAEKMLRERKAAAAAAAAQPTTATSTSTSSARKKLSPSTPSTATTAHATSASLESLSNVGCCNDDDDEDNGNEEMMLQNDEQNVLKSVESLSLVGSSSCSSGLSSKQITLSNNVPPVVVPRRKSTIREADEEEEEEEEESSSSSAAATGAAAAAVAVAAPKKTGGGLFGWFLRKKSATTPSSRIYKTRSCSELKVLKATSQSK